MIKIAHECPLDIFDEIQARTDYDYALVHLFEEDIAYYNRFKDALIQKEREVILDNSIFELGKAYDSNRYSYWINLLQPTWYIIPDVLEDCDGTLNSFGHWMASYNSNIDPACKKIGVVQGRNYDEIAKCYISMEPYLDKVAISFDYSFFDDNDIGTKEQRFMTGRQKLIDYLLRENIINTNKPHHLLGCALPQEFVYYNSPQYSFIDSVDTSNPVVHGINRVRYEDDGLTSKIKTKLIEYMHEKINSNQLTDIYYNVSKFREFCNG